MEYNPFTLKNKTILVTGASSGIGKATAIECARLGAKIIITARNEERLSGVIHLLEGEGHRMIIADIEREDEIATLVENIQFVDGVVHCAGFVNTQLFQFVQKAELSRIMEVNFISPVVMTQMLLSQKKLQKGASVVFVSSIMGTRVSAIGNSMYSATKGAIDGMVKGMALDLSGKKIRVNSVCPGMINTKIVANGSLTDDQLQKDAKENYPLKRYGNPEEVAYAVIYLLSDASSWVTGSSLLIDGGFTLK